MFDPTVTLESGIGPMTLQLPRVMAFTPAGQSDPGIVVAAARASTLGFFDFAFESSLARHLGSISQTSRWLGDRAFGVRLGNHTLDRSTLDQLPATAQVIVATGLSSGEDWQRARELVESSHRLLLAEVESKASGLAAIGAGIQGLIVAGNEAGGIVGEETSFILLQSLMKERDTPVWVRGGIGLHSAAACIAAGASGVILDGALLLARECAIETRIRELIGCWDGTETVVFGKGVGRGLRVQADPGSPAVARLKQAETEGLASWQAALAREVGWNPGQVRPVGQDAALAQSLAKRYVTVGGIVQAVEQSIDSSLSQASEARPIAEGSALARSHGTRFPVVQGPMTRVSDRGAFAKAVADGGALPFLALALMPGDEVEHLLVETRDRLGEQPWGVGVLGFVAPELRREQVAAILKVRPRFALIAGGRPDQAQDLEAEGITTYLHAPSPGILRQYWKDGVRRFVLEGRECGGHVGPRSSLLLWEQAVQLILERLEQGDRPDEVHLLFAGGVHDARSSAAVAALSAPLAQRGVKVGVLVGTAYLFTKEAVETGAIVPGFQDEAVRCTETVLLETGPGHEIRVSPTPYIQTFEQERIRLLASGEGTSGLREALEGMNAGRLRLAAKGVERKNGRSSPLLQVGLEGQVARGMYMLGQAAALQSNVSTISELHRDLCEGATDRIANFSGQNDIEGIGPAQDQPCNIAIIGMATILPGASDVQTFWSNTLKGRDAITEVPEDRWDWNAYYDADPKAPDRITSRWGGFVPEVPFNPLRYGMPPSTLSSIEPLHLLTLEAVRSAIDDAGYRDRPFPRERTAVVLGAGGGAAQLAMGYAFRSYLPMLDSIMPGVGTEALERCKGLLPEWTEDSFPGILLNVAAGRVANRFNLGGANYTVDAACGSSLAAASVAVRELESRSADVVILGGADTVQNPFTYLAFSKTQAFSPRGRCRPFDASADGIVISEGVAVVVLKRLEDAERDGDRIYAVIKGIGASSDGRAKGLTAPRPEGQVSALTRAYARSGIDPSTVGYVEAHGTGTAAGDKAEVNALTSVFKDAGAGPKACALGSVKSLVGHTKCAAGLVGLINASLSLHHAVLPPTIGVENPSEEAANPSSPFHISTKTRPWFHAKEEPRRAGVSAFGFGGTNFHAVLEAHQGPRPADSSSYRDWSAELFAWREANPALLIEKLNAFATGLSSQDSLDPSLPDLAQECYQGLGTHGIALAIIASSREDLREKVKIAMERLTRGEKQLTLPEGLFLAESPKETPQLAFLFPGQGAQRLEMLEELALAFPEVREGFEAFDRKLGELGQASLTPLIFPPPGIQPTDREERRKVLSETDRAQPALGGACVGLLALYQSLGLEPNVAAGHSYGELVALHAGGSFSRDGLIELTNARGALLKQVGSREPGGMAALGTGLEKTRSLLDGVEGVEAVNWNGPKQTVISGRQAAVATVVERAQRSGIRAQPLAVSCAFHSRLVSDASEPLTSTAQQIKPTAPSNFPVYSNLNAQPYPASAEMIAQQIGDHLASPVQFAPMIEALYTQGVQTFLEVGPGSTLTSLTTSILGTRPHLALATEPTGKPGLQGLLLTLGRLFVAGHSMRLERLTAGRTLANSSLPGGHTDASDRSPVSSWLVNGSWARPADGPIPARLGMKQAAGAEPTTSGAGNPTPIQAPVESPNVLNGQLPPTSTQRSSPSVSKHSESRRRDFKQPMTAPLEASPMNMNGNAGKERVLESFQQTMRMFLEVQRETMLGYLGASAGQLVQGQSAPNSRAQAPVTSPPPPPPQPRSTQAPAQAFERVKPAAQEPIPSSASAQVSSTTPRPETEHSKVVSANGSAAQVDVATKLLGIVRDRTGYPAEMLGLDLDLEADLGIDSIKRVEILGTLRDSLPDSDDGFSSELMDQLSRARTLGSIVDRIEKGLATSSKNEPRATHRNGSSNGHPVPTQSPPASKASASVRQAHKGAVAIRRTLEAVRASLPTSGSAALNLTRGGQVLITDDRRGVATELARGVRARGLQPHLIRHATGQTLTEKPDAWEVDLSSPEGIQSLLSQIRSRGSICALIHTLPLATQGNPRLDRLDWSDRLAPEVRGLFLLAKTAADDLIQASERGGACLIACTAMGGGFASVNETESNFFPGQGGIAGIIKTLAREWPASVRTRVVDFSAESEVAFLSSAILEEVGARDPRAEVGYLNQRRIALRSVEAPLRRSERGRVLVKSGEPILVTGGARGITAVLTVPMGKAWKPTFLIVGTSPPPRERESKATAHLTDAAQLKSVLHQLRLEARKEASIAQVEKDYQDLKREREIRKNLERLRDTGAGVEYAQVDVRDELALKQSLDHWQTQFGPIRGLIHGAGVIHDKLLKDKTLESFDRVLDTKLDGALNLAKLLDADSLRFAAFFSSVAGRFGNRGQVDYAAANEILNKLGVWLDRQWPGRVVSLNWGPWAEVGMVSELEAHLKSQGLGLMSPVEHGDRLLSELQHGDKGRVEVIISGDISSLLGPDEQNSPAPRNLDPSDESLVLS